MPPHKSISFWLCLSWFFLQDCSAVVTHIPSPNVCKPKATNALWSNWDSPDCPPTAACVPIKGNDTYGYCSCKLKPEHHKLEGSKCVASTHGVAFAVCVGVVCVAALCSMIFGLHQLVVAKQRKVLKLNTVFATGAIAVPMMLDLSVFMVSSAILYTKESTSHYKLVQWVNRISVLIEGLCALSMLLLFGLSINEFVAHSEQLQFVNQNNSRRIILCRTIVLDVVLVAMVTPLAIFGQWAVAALVWGVFGLVCLALYNNTLNRFTKIHKREDILNSVSSRDTQMKQTLQIIRRLCSRLLCAIISFCVFCVVLITAWIVGRHERSFILMGVVYSWAMLGMHISIFGAALSALLFLRKLVAIRSLNSASSTPSLHSQNTQSTIVFSLVSPTVE